MEFNHRRLLVQISFWTWSSIKSLHVLLNVQTREYFALEGSYWGVKIVTDIFGIGNIVPIWKFCLVTEQLYTGMFLFSTKPAIFLVPFYNAGFAELNFFPSALIWSNQNIFRLQGTLTNVNSCTLYLYLYYQALCLYCLRYIDKKDKGKLDLLF